MTAAEGRFAANPALNEAASPRPPQSSPRTASRQRDAAVPLPGRPGVPHRVSARDPAAPVPEKRAVDLVVLQRPILARASEPFPTPLGTLDALHLATALVWRDRNPQELVVATHDRDLALAARSFGFVVAGA